VLVGLPGTSVRTLQGETPGLTSLREVEA
jgi:hypothetical protein